MTSPEEEEEEEEEPAPVVPACTHRLPSEGMGGGLIRLAVQWVCQTAN